MSRLSKSRIMSSLQCARRVHLEIHRRDLMEFSPATRAAFDIGHQVGEIAMQAYGGDAGTLVPYAGGNFQPALRQTRELMDGLIRAPVYEATLEFEGVLVREDVLLPVGDSWRIVEIKASTRKKPEHAQDCAIQAWVHQGAGYALEGIALGHVNNEWKYDGSDHYEGYFNELDLTDEVMALLPSVPYWVSAARAAVEGPMPDVPVGQHCFSPYECPFTHYCWPQEARYPVLGLGGSKKKLGEYVAAGCRDIREVPLDSLSNNQQRIARVTRRGNAEIRPAAGDFMRELDYPRYYLDFETVGPAVPVWPGTRPYEAVPVQYSCQIEQRGGELREVEFLDLSGQPPMRALAEQLISDLGSSGPVLMYTTYERSVIRALAERFPDLAEALEQIIARLEDMHPVVKDSYYHPDMLGSWSIKAVLPTIAPDMGYETLGGIKEGTEASNAFLEAIRPDIDPAEKQRLEQELLTYCRHDTLAMVRLAQFFANH